MALVEVTRANAVEIIEVTINNIFADDGSDVYISPHHQKMINPLIIMKNVILRKVKVRIWLHHQRRTQN